MSDEELEKIVREIVETQNLASQQDFGRIMGQVMPRVKGRADGNKVGEAVKKVLSEEKVKNWIKDKAIKNCIIVPQKLVNIVTN